MRPRGGLFPGAVAGWARTPVDLATIEDLRELQSMPDTETAVPAALGPGL